MKVLKWPLLSIVIPRLALIGFMFGQPFLINRAIHFASVPANEQVENAESIGNGLIAAYVIVYIGIAVSYLSSFHNWLLLNLRDLSRCPWVSINI